MNPFDILIKQVNSIMEHPLDRAPFDKEDKQARMDEWVTKKTAEYKKGGAFGKDECEKAAIELYEHYRDIGAIE